MENARVTSVRVRDFSKERDVLQTILIYLVAFLVPTFLGKILSSLFGSASIVATNSQIIIGSIVNTALILTALNLKGNAKILGVVAMPSVSTILGGYVFHTASVFMVYMIPAIWLGNYALVYLFKLLLIAKKKNYFLTSICAIVTKVAIIFACFSILKYANVFLDKIVTNLQTAMSLTQLITASIGAFIASGFYFLEREKK